MTPSRTRDVVSTVATSILAICALVITVAVVRRVAARDHAGPDRVRMQAQPDWREYEKGGHRVGSRDAKALLVNFSDYQCPFCKSMEERLQRARDRYPDAFAVIYRQWPLARIHPHATTAAIASECAAMQGSFERMHEMLFSKQDSLGLIAWPELASRSAIPNVAAFSACMTDRRAVDAVNVDVDAAQRLGAQGTPVLLIGGMRISGAIGDAMLDSLIQAELSGDSGRRGR